VAPCRARDKSSASGLFTGHPEPASNKAPAKLESIYSKVSSQNVATRQQLALVRNGAAEWLARRIGELGALASPQGGLQFEVHRQSSLVNPQGMGKGIPLMSNGAVLRSRKPI
jgi:hypothetical protein